MNHRLHVVWGIALLAAWSTVGNCVAQDTAPAHDAVTPVSRAEDWWQQRQAKINAVAAEGDVDLIFLGDSITQGWNDNAVWQKYYGSRKAANMGIGGDRTQHVLWRLDNGNIDGLAPKLVVLMIGTNNSGANTAEEISDGIKAIVAKLRSALPETKILLLGIFPRGEQFNPLRSKNIVANQLARQVADGESVHYLDIGEAFLNDDGSLSKEIMPDYLHLTIAGYQIWADSIEEKVAELMGEK